IATNLDERRRPGAIAAETAVVAVGRDEGGGQVALAGDADARVREEMLGRDVAIEQRIKQALVGREIARAIALSEALGEALGESLLESFDLGPGRVEPIVRDSVDARGQFSRLADVVY